MSKSPIKRVRCAIYTRKSTEEGLEQEFNSLDAQREAAEAYIKSQTHDGRQCVADRYDDGGFTGGNMERPALQKLMTDIAAGKLDCVVVYKVDRLSRSLLDFARMMETFERHAIAFVSVTQQFNTATSMGRLVLNVLLSFAQFEREIISERTRDKIAATRRKGKWSGGPPILGYDLDPRGSRLIVNETEAEQVRAIFALYLEHQSLLPVVEELARRGWTNKRRLTRKETIHGGKEFTRNSLHSLLTNVIYNGQLRYKEEIHKAEHTAIVDPGVFQRVREQLDVNRRTGGDRSPDRFHALLSGLVHCRACDATMSPTASARGPRRYRYYTCNSAIRRGRATCPNPSLPAATLEEHVMSQLAAVENDPRQSPEIRQPLTHLRRHWSTWSARQQAQHLGLLIEQVAFDAEKPSIAIRFHESGFRTLAESFNISEETV